MKDAPGARISDYLIECELPARNTEVAYRATHRVLPRCARVVILNPAFIGVRPAELHLMREACILEALHHPGVPRVYECGVLERRPWVAMEHVEGTSIEQAAAERPIALSDAIAVMRDAAAILAHAHKRGVIHRSITPRSIVRTPARGFSLCITEWGDASIDERSPRLIDETTSAHPVPSYTRFYRAPELATFGRADTRADIYSLGAVVFEAATLVLPEPVQKFPGIPEPFHQLLAGMLARFPGDRPTAETVAAEAARLVEVFSDGDGQIEEVEVELVDIANTSAAMSSLGWVPPDRITKTGHTLGSLRRRRDTEAG
jgi:eukaryotic-like serine/threonine-protein kinase